MVEGADALPDPVAACRALAELGQITLLLEGGPAIAGTWWRAGVVTRGVVYVGARMGGGVGRAPLDGVFSSIEGAEVVSVTGLRSLSGDIRVDFRRI